MKKPKITVLENGLSIISINTGGPSTTVLTIVSTGSKFETKEKNGISHFLEHMCFKGTDKKSGKEIATFFDELGAETNAFTSKELTGYYVKSIHKFWKKSLGMVADIYIHSTFPESEIEKEKGVIIGEIAMYDDMPMHQVYDIFDDLVFGDEPAGMSVLGTKETVQALTYDDFIDYHKKHYVASGTAIVVAGDITHSELVKEVSEKFKTISVSKKHLKKKTKISQQKSQLSLKYKETDQTHIVLGYLSEKRGHKDTIILNTIAGLLAGGMSSRLFERLREDLGLGYYVGARNKPQDDIGTFEINCGVDSARVEEALKEIQSQIKRFLNEEVTEKELKKVKDQITCDLQMNLELSDDIAYFYGKQYISGLGYRTPKEIIRMYKQVTTKDIKRVAKKIFKNERLNCAILGPHDKRDISKFKRAFILK